MSNWQSVDLSRIVPPQVPQVISQVTSVIDQFLTLYKQSIAVAKQYQNSLNSGDTDVLGSAIKALTDVIEGLLQAGKVHALFVPIPKQFPSVSTASVVAPTLADFALELGYTFEQTQALLASGANQAYSTLTTKTGGNAAFFKAFVESLNDVYDADRPQYTSAGDAVTMTVLMVGAASFSGLIDVAASFNRLFRPRGNSDLTSRMVPVPQNLRAKVIALPKATSIGVRLDWSPPQFVYDSPYFPGVTVKVKKYAVIRSTSPKVAASAQSVLDFFSTRDLKEGLTSDDKAQSSKVIAVGSGTNSSYIDNDDLDGSQSYFYCVAWQTEVTENGKTTALNFDRVSNVVKTRVRSAPPGQAIPPDWLAYGSMVDLVPELSVQIRTLLEQVKALGDRQTGGASGSVSSALNLIEKNIDQFATRLDDLNAQVKRFSAIVSEPLPGLYSTTITGVGGNAFLVSELSRRLNDTSDAGRPPYDSNEYVMGVCIVGGGPRLPDIQPIVNFLSALFQPAADESPVLKALRAIDAVVDTQEQYTFGPNLRALPNNPDGTVQIPAGTTLPDGTVVPEGGMAVDPATIDPATGLPKVTPKPVIGEDGVPVDAHDPNNPYTGDP